MTCSLLTRIAILALLAGGLLTACGKRGQLEPPPGSTSAAPEQAQGSGSSAEGLKGRRTPITAPKRALPIDFILD
ncbi:hypothetical protein MCEMSEM23_02147 [Rhabdaerophilaceae bacterium]